MTASHRRRSLRPQIGRLEARWNLSTATTVPPILYVDANAAATDAGTARDGSSWSTAYTSLQDALTEAATAGKPEQIWIAQGTYVPSQASPAPGGGATTSGSTASNAATFAIPDNVTLLGGFVAGQTSAADRSPRLHPTILSGDLGASSPANPAASGGVEIPDTEATHVVTIGDAASGTRARLSGLTITDGDAADQGSAAGPQGTDGGGVLIAAGSTVRIDHCTFTGDSAFTTGGAIDAVGSRLVVRDSTFTGDTSGVAGGAIAAQGGGTTTSPSLVIAGSTFRDDQSFDGGALLVDSVAAQIAGTRFLDNTATVGGGAISTSNQGSATLDPTGTGTTATAATGEAITTIVRSSFVGDVAQGSSTGKASLDGAAGTSGLDVAAGGGAIANGTNGRLAVDADLFRANSATLGDGGAILTGGQSVPAGLASGSGARTRITGSDFLANTAPAGHGGALAAEGDDPTGELDNTATRVAVFGSDFDGNASGQGGLNLDLDDASAAIAGNRTTNTRGTGVAAVGSRVNGVARTTTTTTATG